MHNCTLSEREKAIELINRFRLILQCSFDVAQSIAISYCEEMKNEYIEYSINYYYWVEVRKEVLCFSDVEQLTELKGRFSFFRKFFPKKNPVVFTDIKSGLKANYIKNPFSYVPEGFELKLLESTLPSPGTGLLYVSKPDYAIISKTIKEKKDANS
ncbi:MAG TPA: hypothetical protein VN922_19450 [Bacteroidia bacterium]|nr:hypothetical protein [Bacteroidia bacterium]